MIRASVDVNSSLDERERRGRFFAMELKVRAPVLLAAVNQGRYSRVGRLLSEAVHGYHPESEIVEWFLFAVKSRFGGQVKSFVCKCS